jgi:uncharacterized protein
VSGERLALRVRDPNGEPARAFLGFSWFPIDPKYRVIARFIRDPAPQKLQVINTIDDVDAYSSEGVLEFTLQGQTLRLRPFTTRPKRFYIVFRDASSGVETYATARFLYADLRDDGTAVLDFNEAYNPPCAFNKYTTCPLPLKENILPVKILAGERAYGAASPERIHELVEVLAVGNLDRHRSGEPRQVPRSGVWNDCDLQMLLTAGHRPGVLKNETSFPAAQ